MMPQAVSHLGRFNLRVALGVAVDVETEGKDVAVFLKREQHPLPAVLLAENLVVAVKRRWLDPHTERHLRQLSKSRLLTTSQQVAA